MNRLHEILHPQPALDVLPVTSRETSLVDEHRPPEPEFHGPRNVVPARRGVAFSLEVSRFREEWAPRRRSMRTAARCFERDGARDIRTRRTCYHQRRPRRPPPTKPHRGELRATWRRVTVASPCDETRWREGSASNASSVGHCSEACAGYGVWNAERSRTASRARRDHSRTTS